MTTMLIILFSAALVPYYVIISVDFDCDFYKTKKSILMDLIPFFALFKYTKTTLKELWIKFNKLK